MTAYGAASTKGYGTRQPSDCARYCTALTAPNTSALVATPSGGVVQAKNLMKVSDSVGPSQIQRKNQQRIAYVSADPEGTLSDAVTAVAFSPRGDRLATAGTDRFARITGLQTNAPRFNLEGHTHHVIGLAWSPDGGVLATAGAEARASLLYGKLSLLGRKILYYDLHGGAGAAMVRTENGTYPAPVLSIGQNIFLSNSLTFRVDYRLLAFREDIIEREITAKLGQNVGTRTNFTNSVTFGFSWIWGGSTP